MDKIEAAGEREGTLWVPEGISEGVTFQLGSGPCKVASHGKVGFRACWAERTASAKTLRHGKLVNGEGSLPDKASKTGRSQAA